MRFANSVEYSSNSHSLFTICANLPAIFFQNQRAWLCDSRQFKIQNWLFAWDSSSSHSLFIIRASGAVFFDEIKGRESHIVWQSTHGLTLAIFTQSPRVAATHTHTHALCVPAPCTRNLERVSSRLCEITSRLIFPRVTSSSSLRDPSRFHTFTQWESAQGGNVTSFS